MTQSGSSRYRLGVDVGGTHTDLVLLDTASGTLAVEKVASTPGNPALGVLTGMRNLSPGGQGEGHRVFRARHDHHHQCTAGDARGKGRPVSLPRGNRAVQEVQKSGARRKSVRLLLRQTPPIAPQSLTKEIPERTDHAGQVLVPLDEEAVRRAARELKSAAWTPSPCAICSPS